MSITDRREKTDTKTRRGLAAIGIALAACALLLTSASLPVQSDNARTRSRAPGDERNARQAELKLRLASTRANEFRDALAALTRLDEPGALDTWRAALDNPDAQLRREAWIKYRAVHSELSRKQFIPQIARIRARADDVVRAANSAGLDVTIWSAADTQTFAAAPPYLIERLRDAGTEVKVVYDSVAEWQQARASGDALAQAITPEYQSAAAPVSLVRIAVIDLAERTAAAPGYSDWLGDRENILMRDGSRIAFMDIFPSDGSPESISGHMTEQYAKRGYRLRGYYTSEEFARAAPRLFPGRSFDAGVTGRASGIQTALASGKFHSFDATVSEFKALAAAHPDLARYVKLGSSFEGRDIFALKISRDAAVDDASKPDVLITGNYHAREWISVESPVYIANRLVNEYATDDSIKYLVDHLQVWIVPIVNPDGLAYTQNANDSSDSVRLWRKNRRPISLGGCVTTVGVDLNRNYNYQWRTRDDTPCADYCSSDRSCFNDDVGASDDPRNEIYRGPEPESEPELKALKSLVDDPNRHFRAQLDYHNYSQLILYPWGYAPFGTDDARTLSDLGDRVSNAMFGVAHMRYRSQQAIDLYATTGSSIDYAYAVNHIPAPFVVEMRPVCCSFDIPESEIPVINQENWAGAALMMNWAAGPPILESVKAYSQGPDGAFSRLAYSVRWTASPDTPGAERQKIIEARFPNLDPGPLQVRLQFSKPMSSFLPPRVTMGRDAVLNELALSATNQNEGWQKTFYKDDTWVGETVIIQDDNLTSAWRLAVSATDTLGFLLDAVPATRAGYTVGDGHWHQYEDSDGQGHDGGTDTQHLMAPGARGDYSSIIVTSPGAGERLAAGETYKVVWTVPSQLGFVPVEQALMISIDGGVNFGPLISNLPISTRHRDVVIPAIPSTRARMGLMVVEPVFGNFLIAPSLGDFTIGVNVGTGVDISFVSSERVDLNWTDTSSDDPPSTASGASRLIVNLKITNRGNVDILNPFLRVEELTRNVLLTRDLKSSWAAGGRQTIDAGSDNVLSPGETADARLVIGLTKAKKFNLSVEMYGVASGGTILPASGFNVWSGKPKTR